MSSFARHRLRDRRSRLQSCAVAALLFGLFAASVHALNPTPDTEHGGALYAARCAQCHDKPAERVPTRLQLAGRSPETVINALDGGVMMQQGQGLSLTDRQSLALFLTGKIESAPAADPVVNLCAARNPPFVLQPDDWRNWGYRPDNGRYHPTSGLKATEVPRLALVWAFAYPGDTVYGQPAIAAGRVFVSTHTGMVLALDAATGCMYWHRDLGRSARAGVVVAETTPGEFTAFIGDDAGIMHALDARTGEHRWEFKIDAHVATRLTGSPVFHDGRLYVTASSSEEGLAMQEDYPCCTFRGSLSALDARTGRLLWKSYVVDEPRPFPNPQPGKARFGPAGGAIWSPPTIDAAHGEVFVATGNSYTNADAEGTDAVVAFDLSSGARKWIRQLTSKDNFIGGCGVGTHGGDGHNCPDPLGGDWDFGAPPILRVLPNGRRVLLAPQKSGVLWALDADRAGAVLWSHKLGQSSPIGGLVWGSAADTSRVYAAYTGDLVPTPDAGPNGIAAIDIASGEIVWNTVQPGSAACSWGEDKCAGGFMQAVTVIPGVVFAGSLDAHLRAWDTTSGRILWDVDTYGNYPAVNGTIARGGSLAQGGVVLADGRLFVNSGYAPFWGKPGNALLVFAVDGK